MILDDIPVFWAIVPLLIATIYFDLRYMRLPNPISLTMVGLFFILAPFTMEISDIFWRVTVAAIVFGIGLAAFATRLVGGGDVKVLAALMLFIPMHLLATFFLLFGVCLLFGTLLVVTLRKTMTPNKSWAFLSAAGRFPMGLAIGTAGLALFAMLSATGFAAHLP